MQIHVTIEDGEVRAMLGKLAGRLGNLTPVMRNIGEIVRASIERNFEAGGRPDKWPLSGRVKNEGGQTLTDKAILRRSFTVRGYPDRAEVGTNVKYAAIHQLGIDGNVNIGAHQRKVKSRDIRGRDTEHRVRTIAKGIGFVRAHTRHMRIPARPFMMVQDDDWPKMTQALGKFFVDGTV